ncbi:hypothetical protein ABEX45_00390 [Bacillus subtilis]
MRKLTDLVQNSLGKKDKYDRNVQVTEFMKDGIYRTMSNGVFVASKKVHDYSDLHLFGLPEGFEGVRLLIDKIPFKYWIMVLDFYKDVYEKHGTEASVLFYYNHADLDIPQYYPDGIIQDGRLIVYCPKQRNTGVRSKFDDEQMRWLEDNTYPILETHSHHVMKTFFSTIDDLNEQRFMFYGVYGEINTYDNFKLRYMYQGEHVEVPATTLFEFPDWASDRGDVNDNEKVIDLVDIEKGCFKNTRSYPDCWFNQIDRSVNLDPVEMRVVMSEEVLY